MERYEDSAHPMDDISAAYGIMVCTIRTPLPAPNVPGETETEAERMSNAVKMLFSASKEAFVKQEMKIKRARERKRAKSK